MSFIIGITLALVVGVSARRIGLDRDRAFYPTVGMVVASYMVLFSTIAGSTTLLLVEISISLCFIALALAGFKKSIWFAVAAIGLHGVFDFVHPHVIVHPGMPVWWPGFCGGYDFAAAA